MEDYSDSTVIIPVRNEPALERVAKGVIKALPKCKIIVVSQSTNMDDNKTVEKIRKETKSDLLFLKQNAKGKGRACIFALSKVKTKIVCFIDGDNTYEPRDLEKLINIIRKGADMALGNRFANIKSEEAMPKSIQRGNNMLTALTNVVYKTKIKDSQTGLRALKTSKIKEMNLKEVEFGIENEMNIKAAKMKMTVKEIPTSYYEREGETKQSMKLVAGAKLGISIMKHLFD